MNIMIAGGGKVGSVLCSELATDENNIILIEKNEAKLETLIHTNDIAGIVGNAASYDIQQEAGVKNCDIFIAVTPEDEVNIVACILAKSLGAKYTIARVRNPEYSRQFRYLRESLGVDMMINPEYESARSISRILKFPTVVSMQSFADNKVDLIELEIGPTSPLANLPLLDFRNKYGDILVCAISRKMEIIIPSGQNKIKQGDHVFILGETMKLRKFYRTVRPQKNQVHSVMILGGGRITYYLLELLAETKLDIKIIEQNEKVAEELSAAFPTREIILGDGTDQELLEREGISNYDAFISLTGVDEENIIASLYASHLNISQIITKVNRELLLRIFDQIGMESIITPKRVIANKILYFVRSLTNTSVSNVEALYRIADNRAEAIQFKVKSTSRAINIPLQQLQTKPDVLIASIIRGRERIIPTGQDSILPDDRVVIITKDKYFDDIDDILK